ncbi:CBS domain-containing protein [Phosphitispora sp. TUW77]|uniref:CBS domain-containing protein n=1 Tax=Phosphitispora sp. TUW77 TaxID=3152361 RepID=UPI003AB4EF92
MLVKDLMSYPVVTVSENSTVGEALDILKKKNIKHLPVIDKNQSLVGAVTESDLLKVFPHGKELSSFESNLLLRTPVSKVMKTNPISIAPDEIIEKAALIMCTNRVSSLPILEGKKLVGFITKNGIIEAFITALGYREGGTRVTIIFQKKWGFLSELVSFIDSKNIHIDNIVTFGNELVLKVKGNRQDFASDLKQAGYTVVDVSYIEPCEAKAK